MKIKGQISILVGSEGTRIEIHDKNANIRFIEIKLTPEDLSRVLSREAFVPCDMDIRNLDLVGTKHECKKFEFKLSDNNFHNRQNIARKDCAKKCPKGWEPASTFNSQDSFFEKDGEEWARCTIRGWT